MKNPTKYIVATFLLATVLLPGAVMAARRHNSTPLPPSVTQFDTPAAAPEQLQTVNQWRNSNDLQDKIAALGSTPVATFPIPVLFGVAPSDLSDNYGVLRPSGRIHEGEDIMALKGTPIVSPTDAVVILTNYDTGGGNSVYTVNPGGETFVYYHLDRVGEGIARGLVLKPGSLIGYVGNTGSAAGGAPHLHFEVRVTNGNAATDPFPRLEQEFTPSEKIAYLATILGQTSDPKTLAEFLVTNFRGTFTLALAANISLPLPIIDALAAIPASTLPSTGGISLPFGDLDIGSTGSLVVNLQKYLIQAASGVAATRLAGAGATGNFGALTKAALVEYQAKVGISPASGYYGTTTRAFILAHPLATLPPVSTIPPVSGGKVALTRNLYLGVSGEDVRALQKLLNANGYIVALSGAGSPGNETLFFGNATQAAVIKFQTGHNIIPAAGYVGPITRTALTLLQ